MKKISDLAVKRILESDYTLEYDGLEYFLIGVICCELEKIGFDFKYATNLLVAIKEDNTSSFLSKGVK